MTRVEEICTLNGRIALIELASETSSFSDPWTKEEEENWIVSPDDSVKHSLGNNNCELISRNPFHHQLPFEPKR